MDESTKQAVDGLALGGAAGSFFQVLPSITALASLCWIVIRIYETETVQNWINRNK